MHTHSDFNAHRRQSTATAHHGAGVMYLGYYGSLLWLVIFLIAGCSRKPSEKDRSQADSSERDSAQLDSSIQDSAQIDSVQLDSSIQDSAQIDSDQADSSTTASEQIDSEQIDSEQIDSEQIDPENPCHACAPCEICELNEDGVAICVAESHVTQACIENNIHWIDACGTDEGLAVTCAENAVCKRLNSEYICGCANFWQGDNCDECPDHFDGESNCSSCLPGWDPVTLCQSCFGNFDPSTECTTCRNRWTGSDCDVCPSGFDETSDCSACRNQWGGVTCNICPSRFSVQSDCSECAGHWQGANCDECPLPFNEFNGCSGCLGNWTGENCDVCPDNFAQDDTCTVCANHWTGSSCNVCPENFTTESGCAQCFGNWEGVNCDECPAQFDADNNCVGCAGNWQGDNCDECPEQFNADNDCSGCTENWYGNTCNQCPENFSMESNCTECANHWTGPKCDVCPSSYGGYHCDTAVIQCIRYVNANSVFNNANGLKWETAFSDIQAGVDAAAAAMAADGGTTCEVWVSAALDTAYIYQNDANDTITLSSGIKLRGGFDGTEASLDERSGSTPIYCHQPGNTDMRVNTCISISDSVDVEIDKIAIFNGKLGVSVTNSSISVTDSHILYFENDGPGGGLFANNATIAMSGVQMVWTEAESGGAVYARDSQIVASDFEVTSPLASQKGGAVFAQNTTLEISDASIYNMQLMRRDSTPSDGLFGSFLFADNCQISIADCTVFHATGITGSGGGGYAYFSNSEFEIRNTEFADVGISTDPNDPLALFLGQTIASINSTGLLENVNMWISSSGQACQKGEIHVANSSLTMRNCLLRSTYMDETCADTAMIYVNNMRDRLSGPF
ncbi:MAG: hypothetical protein JXX14_25075 [Deltaproteobacteria bacterium]|nr:hypothetical protein [Deltaproteobacteria bacterium]